MCVRAREREGALERERACARVGSFRRKVRRSATQMHWCLCVCLCVCLCCVYVRAYSLQQVDVEVEGLSLKRTSEIFDTEEDPLLSTGKVP